MTGAVTIDDIEKYFPDLVPFFDSKPYHGFMRKKLADALEIEECPEVDKWTKQLLQKGLEFVQGNTVGKALYALQREGWIFLQTTTRYPVVGTFVMSKNRIMQYMSQQLKELDEIVRYRKVFYCGDEKQVIECGCYGYPLKAISSSPNPICSEQKKAINTEMPERLYMPRIEVAKECKKRLEKILDETWQNQKDVKEKSKKIYIKRK
jgi:hypothetical protein